MTATMTDLVHMTCHLHYCSMKQEDIHQILNDLWYVLCSDSVVRIYVPILWNCVKEVVNESSYHAKARNYKSHLDFQYLTAD